MKKLTKEIILETLHKNRDKIKSFGVKKLVLFGSFARDKQKKTSDIDFLVEYKKGRGNYKDKLEILHYLEDLFERQIDIGTKENLKDFLKESISEAVQYEARI